MELQRDVGIEAEAEVIIENVQRELQQQTKGEVKVRNQAERKIKLKPDPVSGRPWERGQSQLQAEGVYMEGMEMFELLHQSKLKSRNTPKNFK